MYGTDLVEASFVSRENRFAALVDVDGERKLVHVPNTGRMRELLVPEATVLLLEARSPTRRTDFDLVSVEASGVTVSVDSRVPNILVSEGLASGSIPGLEDFRELRREYGHGNSRFDFLLEGPQGEAIAEVKGCTLVDANGLALFPDAPTERGARHVRELARVVEEDTGAFVVIVVQRGDGRVFSPNDRTDPAFGEALRGAARAGVKVLAMSTEVTRQGVNLTHPILVDLDAGGGSLT